MADAAHEQIETGSLPEGHWLTDGGDRDQARIIYSADQIQRRVREIAAEITRHYPSGEELLVLGLLKGSFIFLADLVRAINRPLHVDFIVASSYGSGTTSSGNVRLLYDPMAPIADRHVLLVEDIVDSGNTVNRLAEALDKREPKSLELCALLHKHLATDLQLEPRWTGFDAPPEFLVGYGLDHAEDFRHLPFVAGL